jgi:multiple sugar transport system ATP-binding protein
VGSISIEQLEKAYGSVKVLHDINLEIADGEFLVLVGPSGCGKSTLLRTIAGLETMSGGDIKIKGNSVKGVPPRKRNLAMVFQNYALYPHMNVRENIGFSLKLAGVDANERDRRIQEVAEILGLTDLLDRKPKALSGGQRQRVGMGRAIIREPQAFLFDEPLSNLDAKLRVQMRFEIKELHQRVGSTFVYVTHDQVEAMTMADRIVLLEDGYIRQIGAPLELYDRPNNLFAASFIGSPSMNFIEGEVVKSGPDAKLKVAGDVLLPLPETQKLVAGQRVICGIRPENIALNGSYTATVHDIEPMGAETMLICDFAESKLTVLTRDRVQLARGMKTQLGFEVDKIHLFDPESGERI